MMKGFIAVVVLACWLGCAAADDLCEELKLNSSSSFAQAFNCAPTVPIAAVSYLWRPKEVVVACTSTPTAVLVGPNLRELEQQVLNQSKPAWCGWQGLVNPRNCYLTLSPFQPAVVAVQIKRGSLISVLPGSASCNATVSSEFNLPRFALGVLGVLLFLHAPSLSESMVFRLSSGTLIFVCMGLVVLAFWLMRMVPQRRSVVAAMFALGSTSMAFVRWVYGTWLPTWQEAISNPFFLGYLGVTTLLGLSLTYYFDNRNDNRITNILCVGLRLVGMTMLFFSPTAYEASGAFVALLLLTQLPWSAMWNRLVPQHTGQNNPVPATVAHSPNRAPEHQEPSPPQPARTRMSVQRQAATSVLRQAAATPLPDVDSPVGPVPQAQPGSSSRTAPGKRESMHISPLLQRAVVLNVVTGRPVKTDSFQFRKMLASGQWVVDHMDGTISPAPAPPPTPAPTQPTQADASYMSTSVNRRRAVQSSTQAG